MIQKIITGIIGAIHSEFSSYDVYTESVEQGLETPCFSVLCINPSSEQKLGDRFQKSYQFMIQYFSDERTEELRSECLNVCEILQDCLHEITVDGKLIRCKTMNGTITDDVLHFEVVYEMLLHRVNTATDETMERVII